MEQRGGYDRGESGQRNICGDDHFAAGDSVVPNFKADRLIFEFGDFGIFEEITSIAGNGARECGEILQGLELRLTGETNSESVKHRDRRDDLRLESEAARETGLFFELLFFLLMFTRIVGTMEISRDP